MRRPAETLTERDLAPWVAETLERLSRDPHVSREEGGVRDALKRELDAAPREVKFEELLRGSAIALELMAAEAVERIRAIKAEHGV